MPRKTTQAKHVVCKRSAEEFVPFNNQLEDLPEYAVQALPGSMSELQNIQWNNVDQTINAIFSIFLIVKMFLAGHPRSKKYFEEVCANVYPNLLLQVSIELCYNK